MIVIDESQQEATATHEVADVVPVHDLLAACAREAARIALAAEKLDTSMGALLSHFAGKPDGVRTDDTHVRTLAQDLQDADRIRQELSGLARALDLAVAAQSMTALLSAEQVRTCTPLGTLQTRLLSQRSADNLSGSDRG